MLIDSVNLTEKASTECSMMLNVNQIKLTSFKLMVNFYWKFYKLKKI